MNTIDISGIWRVGHRFYVITQVEDRFVWRSMTRQGEQTGIGEFTGEDTLNVVWDYHGGTQGVIKHATGHIQTENGLAKTITWSDGEVFIQP